MNKVEEIRFADGTVWDIAYIENTLKTLTGTSGNDILTGYEFDEIILGYEGDDTINSGAGNDIIDGGDGNDTLRGGGGNDIIDGGLGNDELVGGSGNDNYKFDGNFGSDIVRNDVQGASTDYDIVAMGYTNNNVVLSRFNNDLKLQIAGQGDTVTMASWYVNENAKVDEIRSSNGVRVLGTQVDQLIQAMATFTTQTGFTWEQAAIQNNLQYIEIIGTYYTPV